MSNKIIEEKLKETERNLESVRSDLREIDQKIAELFEQRMDYAAELGQLKKKSGAEVYDKKREEENIQNITKKYDNPFVVKGLEEVMIQMMSISRKYQYHMVHQRDRYIENYFSEVPKLMMFPDTRVVFPGVAGSFSEMACIKYFGEEVDRYSVVNFKEVPEALNEGYADYGILPIENSSAGDVTGVYDILLENDVCIVGEVFVKVNHCLLGCKGSKLSDIKTVYSHPQALRQSAPYLEELGVERVTVENTAIAAEMIARDGIKSQGAVASSKAAEIYGLDILQEGINFDSSNETRFVVLSKKRQYCTDASKISICFSLQHESGTLYNILSHFLYNDLNLSHIESVPLPDRQWEYRFYLDIGGNLHDPSVKNALQGVRAEVAEFKILGNY